MFLAGSTRTLRKRTSSLTKWRFLSISCETKRGNPNPRASGSRDGRWKFSHVGSGMKLSTMLHAYKNTKNNFYFCLMISPVIYHKWNENEQPFVFFCFVFLWLKFLTDVKGENVFYLVGIGGLVVERERNCVRERPFEKGVVLSR